MASKNLIGTSSDKTIPGVEGDCTADGGVGVKGECKNAGGFGVWGICDTGHGVHGQSKTSKGVVGESEGFQGVFGKSHDNVGVAGESTNASAMAALSHSADHAAIIATNDANGVGVQGRSGGNVGVLGEADTGRGVMGTSNANFGVSGVSVSGIGIHGKGGRLAGFFDGDVEVTGDIRLTNADCAEDFNVAGMDKVEPGTVMVLDNEGAVSESRRSYDKRVAGVISGAGTYRPGIVLDKQQTSGNRQPVALMGKVFCKVDAQFGAIEVGDLLTTSPTPGHAMKTIDPSKAFGAVIGKALRPLNAGQGLIPILITLQ